MADELSGARAKLEVALDYLKAHSEVLSGMNYAWAMVLERTIGEVLEAGKAFVQKPLTWPALAPDAGQPAKPGAGDAEDYWRAMLQEAPPHLLGNQFWHNAYALDPSGAKVAASLEAREILANSSAEVLWRELERRGGLDAAYAAGALLAAEKSKDYNGDRSRDEYFPFGALSYAQMLHVKTLRVVSIARKQAAGGKPTFEGLADSMLDLMNYAAFGVERMRRAADDAAALHKEDLL